VALDAEGRIIYRTEVFAGAGGQVTSLRLTGNDRIVALGQRKVGSEFHAAFMEVDGKGVIVQAQTVRRGGYSAFIDRLTMTTGERVLIGQMSDTSENDVAKVWLVRTNETHEILEEQTFPGLVDAATAGVGGRFAVCVSDGLR
jgi:hypothetical protein